MPQGPSSLPTVRMHERTGRAEKCHSECALSELFPLDLLPCYVKSSKICLHKKHNPQQELVMILLSFAPFSCSGPAVGLCKAAPRAVKRCLCSGGQEEYKSHVPASESSKKNTSVFLSDPAPLRHHEVLNKNG